jgi:hypothetical protein
VAFVDEQGKIGATIFYGWRSKKFYQNWGLDPEEAQDMVEGFIEPFAPQSDEAPYFLDIFKEVLRHNPDFNKRITERYAYVQKNLPDNPFEKWDAISSQKNNIPDNVRPFKGKKVPR